MKGLTLSKRFYEECAKPLFEARIPEIHNRLAIGLVGEGSECFGFDDEHSQDHDFGACFCVWVPEVSLETYRADIEAVLADLPHEFEGFPSRMAPEMRMGRVGLMAFEHFYARFLGRPTMPQTWQEWRAIPEHFLSVATNGEVFHDPSGRFTALRQTLLNYYPEAVRLKKMAARCSAMAQAGQYNVLRSLKRGEQGAAMISLARFTESALSLTFLLNKQYMPFYKWAHRGVQGLPILGKETFDCIEKFSSIAMGDAVYGGPQSKGDAGEAKAQEIAEAMEALCAAFGATMRAMDLSDSTDNWMMAHAESIQSRIEIPSLRHMPVMLE